MYGAFFRVAEKQFHFGTHFCIPTYPSCAIPPHRVQQFFYDILFKVRADFIERNAPFIKRAEDAFVKRMNEEGIEEIHQ
jgi:hypothetical protein